MGLIKHTDVALKMEKLNFRENNPKNFGDECVAWQHVILRLFVYKTLASLHSLLKSTTPFWVMWQEQHFGIDFVAGGRNSTSGQIVTQTISLSTKPQFSSKYDYTKSLGFDTKPQKYLKTSRLI